MWHSWFPNVVWAGHVVVSGVGNQRPTTRWATCARCAPDSELPTVGNFSLAPLQEPYAEGPQKASVYGAVLSEQLLMFWAPEHFEVLLLSSRWRGKRSVALVLLAHARPMLVEQSSHYLYSPSYSWSYST